MRRFERTHGDLTPHRVDALRPIEWCVYVDLSQPVGLMLIAVLHFIHGNGAAAPALLASGRTDAWPRDKAEFTALFDGLELLEPGVVPVSEWHADNEPEPRPTPAEVSV